MTSRKRNLSIIGLVLVLLAASAAVIATKPTVLGLDLRGGVELVYEGRPTPQVPDVTPQSIDDAIETIRKRTDALGVSEPEIQRAGANQISIGLPNVSNADRAIDQVGTTAQLQFYDWEPNVLTEGDRGPGVSPVQRLAGAVPGGHAGRRSRSPRPRPPTSRRAARRRRSNAGSAVTRSRSSATTTAATTPARRSSTSSVPTSG